MTEHFRINEWVGAKVINEAKKTKLWHLASALDSVCYGLTITSDPRVVQYADQAPKVYVDAVKFVGSELDWSFPQFPWLSNTSKTGNHFVANVQMLLLDIVHELERLAVLEVTR